MFCPYCGKAVSADDAFCSACGRRLGDGNQTAPPAPILGKQIHALNNLNLFLIGDDGLVKVGTMFPLVVVAVVVSLGAAIALVDVSGFGSWIAFAVAIALVAVPVVSEFRARRLAGLLALPREALVQRKGTELIPWTSVYYTALKGKNVTFRFAGGWASATVDASDASLLSAWAPSALGDRFTTSPVRPSRLSPMMKLILLTLALFVVTQTILIVASLTPYFPGEEARYYALYNSTKSSLGNSAVQEWTGIYLNNVQIALANLVPGVGLFILAISSYNTGRVIPAAAAYWSSVLSTRVTPADFLVELYILPHSWVEELSYPLSTALGMLAFTWRKQSYSEFANWRTRASTKVALGFAVVALMLAFAAVLEVSEPFLGLDALLLWVPVAVVAAICMFVALSIDKRTSGNLAGNSLT